MKNTFGNVLTVTLFGESHGEAIGAVIDGIAPGVRIDKDYIDTKMALRRPSGKISTARSEKDEIVFESGVYEGHTTGTPICMVIKNADTHSSDYSSLAGKARPGHADFPAFCKYHGFEDARGGGHFSGRITAALVAAGAIVQSALKEKGIVIGTHISRLAGISDEKMNPTADVERLENMEFPLVDGRLEKKMKAAIMQARTEGDSVGGILETAVVGMPAGVGEPWFDTVEGMLSHAMFSVPAVKGIEFGLGFEFADKTGSQANDQMYVENGNVKCYTNNNGGVTGGITNGMPILFRVVVKPTPTISKEQKTVDIRDMSNTTLLAHGRHDPCIVHRAAVVVESVTALVTADMLSAKFGTDWLAK